MTRYTCDSCGGTGCPVCDGRGHAFEEDEVYLEHSIVPCHLGAICTWPACAADCAARPGTPVVVSYVDRRPVHEQRASWDALRATVKAWRDDAKRSNVQRLKMGDQIAKDRKW